MNNFYRILKIKNISKIKFDYYNKCKMSFDIICMDEKVTLNVICMENMIDRIYSKLKIDKTIKMYPMSRTFKKRVSNYAKFSKR